MTQAQFPRRGAWTTLGGSVGIIVAITGEGAEVHLVNAQGETDEVVTGVPLDALTQATLAEIPEPRRPAPAMAQALGYE